MAVTSPNKRTSSSDPLAASHHNEIVERRRPTAPFGAKVRSRLGFRMPAGRERSTRGKGPGGKKVWNWSIIFGPLDWVSLAVLPQSQ
jgi:hypothetical protein